MTPPDDAGGPRGDRRAARPRASTVFTLQRALINERALAAVVTLMDRSNVDTVIVAGSIRKWRGKLVGVNFGRLRAGLEASRDYLLDAAGVERVLF